MRKQWIRDWGRRLVIAALLASALLLLRRTGYYDGIRSRLERSRSSRTEMSAGAENTMPRPIGAMIPLSLTVCAADNGGRYGTAYTGDGPSEVFQRFSLDLGEALGSAGAPAPCTEEEFRACLNRCSVTMEFLCPMPLELLSGWLGVEMSSAAAQHSARLLCLSAAESETLLCYQTEDGARYLCATAVNTDGFRGRTAEYAPNGALYAWESDRLDGGGTLLLLTELPQPAVINSALPSIRDREIDAMLTAVGMNSFVTNSYAESDGTVVYISDENTMRIDTGGQVFFRRAGTPDTRGDVDLTAAVGRAMQIAELCMAPYAGEGALRFAGAAVFPEQRSCTVMLDYTVDGIPVRLASGHAAEIVVRGETVIQAQLQLRRFTRTSGRTELLPCLQAAAIAAAAGGTPELIYADAGEATECMWVIENG